MSKDADSMAAIVQKTQSYEDALILRDETCRSQFLLHPHPTRKVCLFFHGFTAVPEQFTPIGEMFFQAGCNVLIPLLPGHGQAGDWDGDCPPPLPEDQQTYWEFGLEWLQQAQAFGDQVVVGGLSGGSTLAALLALERPDQVDRGLIFAPYLSGTNLLVDIVVRTLDIYFEWKTPTGAVNLGYGGFHMPSLRVFLDMASEVLDRAKYSPAAPMLIVSSGSDLAVGKKEHQALFKTVLQHQPKTWYLCFEKALEVPHNMMTKVEGNEHLDLLLAIAKAYVESDLTWDEVQALAEQMSDGKSFATAVADLNLNGRASEDMPIVVQMLMEGI